MLSKRRAEARHAKQRAAQRYDVWLDDSGLEALVHKIQAQDGLCVRRQSRTRTIWDLTFNDKPVRVVYDKLRKQIVSFIPSEEV